MGAHVKKVEQHDDDRLMVTGWFDGHTDEAGQPRLYMVQGWASAMENHFDAKDYGPDGALSPEARPRAMTDEERRAYWTRLLEEAHPDLLGPAQAPVTLFEE